MTSGCGLTNVSAVLGTPFEGAKERGFGREYHVGTLRE